jgi:hypothetical protein
MAVIDLKALTGEEIRFEFDNLSEKELNSVPPHAPYRTFSVDSNFVTDKIKVLITIPDSREVPKSITVKLANIGNTAEHREAVINCKGRVSKTGLEGLVVMNANAGRPRTGWSYRQKAEIALNFKDRREMLICPINRTTTFNMCFYEAYEEQKGMPATVQSVSAYPDTPFTQG